MKKIKIFLLTLFLLSAVAGCGTTLPGAGQPALSSCGGPSPAISEYGVFVGLSPENADAAKGFRTVVIDGDLFSAEELERLRQNGADAVYSYLNIGSVETFRGCYDKFADSTLGAYENWPEEYLMDVSVDGWQEYLLRKAEELAGKGADGFFLDNADVWYYYPRPEIYRGLLYILENLHSLGLPLLLNGGDSFVRAALAAGDLDGLLTGVNQETVFTSIDFETGSFGAQSPEETAYFQEYLSLCADAGLDVYLTEYGATGAFAEEIRSYCAKNGYACFISDSLELDAAPDRRASQGALPIPGT